MSYSEKFLTKLFEYESLVLETNKIHNLIAPSTALNIRERHSLDALNIVKYIEEEISNKNYLKNSKKINICDFGSGAGFPAVTTALYFKYQNSIPNIKIFAYESIGKKASFLSNCQKILELDNFEIKNFRIEDEKNIKADIITARAFSALDNIFKISKKFLTRDTKFILHKGAKVEEEVKNAKSKFRFSYKIEKNTAPNSEGFIILAENLK